MKKVVSLLLVLVLALGMSTVAFAAKPYDKGTSPDLEKVWLDNFDSTDVGDIDPGKEFEFYLPHAGFVKDGDPKPITATPSGTEYVSKSDATKSKIEVRAKVSKGSDTIETYKLDSDGKYATVYLEFVDPFVFNDPDGKDFDITLYLQIDGKRHDDQGVNITGTLMNEVTEVYADDDYIDSSIGCVMTGEEYNSGVEIDLGEGVVFWAKIFKNKNYYAVADTDVNDADSELMREYKMDHAYKIHQKGFTASNVFYVTLNDLQDGTYYVYTTDLDADIIPDVAIPGDALFAADNKLKYIGKSNEKLPLASNYYLARVKLDESEIEDEDEIDEPDDVPDAPEFDGGTGGDDGSPANINDNPGTGK